MRKLFYKLSNGTIVYTMKEAKASGYAYEIGFEDIPEKEIILTERQRAKRKPIC